MPPDSRRGTLSRSSERVPGILQHLTRLSGSFMHEVGEIQFLHVYARPAHPGPLGRLEFIRAAESGPEGIACVDDVARAALLALAVYERYHTPVARELARLWLEFVLYMQEPEGRFTNFILDQRGLKNHRGRTSHPGGLWWAARAHWALAAGWRVTGEARYLSAFHRGRLAGTADLKVTGVQALALLELYQGNPSPPLRRRICSLCDRLIAAGPDYLRDRRGRAELMPWGYHQFQAVARAGRLFSRIDYLAACERTAEHAIAPLIAGTFAATPPWHRAPQCAYDISTMALGLEELYRATRKPIYREQALECADWLYGNNPHGATLYDPDTGCCSDGLTDDGTSGHCGAESSIEAGFVELARRRLESGAYRGTGGLNRTRTWVPLAQDVLTRPTR